MPLYAYKMGSPLGTLTLCADEAAMRFVSFGDCAPAEAKAELTPLLEMAARQLSEYFRGKRQVFTLPLAPQGTAFQKRVWDALTKIPYGQTRSYAEVAAALGSPRAFRAVGQANHTNPLAILIPCHRVLRTGGELGGYAGGLERKTFLLSLERGAQQTPVL